MRVPTTFRWTGALLLLGVVLFSAATIVAEPFEQQTPLGLYTAIVQHGTTYQLIHLLSALGFGLVVTALVPLARVGQQAHPRLTLTGLTLLGFAALLWLAEVIGRLTLTAATARQVSGGAAVPETFPANLGVGLEPLFVAFLATSLAGLAALAWQMGQAGLLAKRLSLLGACLTPLSGGIAALTYPWVGGVERALFYPLVLVFLPLAIHLLLRRPAPARSRAA